MPIRIILKLRNSVEVVKENMVNPSNCSIFKYVFNVAPILFVRANLHKKLFYTLGFLGLFYFIYSLFFENDNSLIIFNTSILLLVSGYLLEVAKNIVFYIKRNKNQND